MLKLWYWNGRPNAGDFFSAWLLDKMKIKYEFANSADLCITGSILAGPHTTNAKIWGCGFHNIEEKKDFDESQIFAVRGLLTLKNLGMKNKTTGDPGILASYFYKPKVKKKYKYGIIAHYVDEQFFASIKLPSYVTVINVGTNSIENLMDRINECEFILSSSLHGIIFAHSYGIPAIRVKHNELATRRAFKFLDYYSNWNLRYLEIPVRTESDLDWNKIDVLYRNKAYFVPTKYEIEKNQKALLNAFPIKG